MELNFSVVNQRIRYTGKLYIVEKSRNYLTARFSFSGSEWKGIVKTAIFRKGDTVRNVILDENGRCNVPSEVITRGTLEVSVFGGDLVTVDTATVKILKSGYEEGDAPDDPPPDVYAQILEELQLIRTEPIQKKLVAEAVDEYLNENHVEALSREELFQIVVDYVDSHKDELKGADGLSAYEVAVANGFEGTEEEWLESLKGSGGGDGASKEIYGDTFVSNGRLADSHVGINSVAYGFDCMAAGDYSHAEGIETQALGNGSHAEGENTLANSDYSHAEGSFVVAAGACSHAEGIETIATGNASHTEGASTNAYSYCSHAEGFGSVANNQYAHAEGYNSVANGSSSHAEGEETVAGYANQHVQGQYNDNKEDSIFEIGNGTNTSKSNAFRVTMGGVAEAQEDFVLQDGTSLKEVSAKVDNAGGASEEIYGDTFISNGRVGDTVGVNSIAYGDNCIASGDYSQAFGMGEVIENAELGVGRIGDSPNIIQFTMLNTELQQEGKKIFLNIEGYTVPTYTPEYFAEMETVISSFTFNEEDGSGTVTVQDNISIPDEYINTHYIFVSGGLNNSLEASGLVSHAEGFSSKAIGDASHAEGSYTYAIGECSHAEGMSSSAVGIVSHAEGSASTAYGRFSHAEGHETHAERECSHAEGSNTYSAGVSSHAEGNKTRADGVGSHAEGSESNATGLASHAEGLYTEATGDYSHAEGDSTVAEGIGSHAEGNCTYAGYDYQHVQGMYNDNLDDSLFEIGNGTEDLSSNAFRVTLGGVAEAQTDVTLQDGTSLKAIAEQVTSGTGGNGKSAYEIAVENGFVGTEVEWLASLKGEDGYSPVKGTDYFTEADKTELVNELLASLTNAEEVAF